MRNCTKHPESGPSYSLRFTDFGAPVSPRRYPRLLAAGGRGDQPSPAGGRMAADPTFRIETGRRTRPRPQPLPPAGCHPRIRVPHGGARHRRRCCDLVLRCDFDGAWHRGNAFGVRSEVARPPIAPNTGPGGWGNVQRSTFNVQLSSSSLEPMLHLRRVRPSHPSTPSTPALE